MSKYSDKFKDPRWQKKRLEILERDKWTCQICFSTDSTLHVHHRFYEKGKDPWDYQENVLVTLCEGCHQEEHECMSGACLILNKAVMGAGYTSGDIYNIALGFSLHKLPHTPDVSACVIQDILSNEKLLTFLTDEFFSNLSSKKVA
jgi:hypothetical protein